MTEPTLALIPLNPTVGDLDANARAIAELAREACDRGAGLLVFPELALTGYPPRDLLLHRGFLEDTRDAARALARSLPREAVTLVGAPWLPDASPTGPGIPAHVRNAVLVIRDGEITDRYDKRLLPTYDVFDEARYFRRGDRPLVIDALDTRVGIAVCEDLWRGVDAATDARYADQPDPVADTIDAGARVIVCPSASPFVLGKQERQHTILRTHVQRHAVPVAMVNQCGGNDDLVFDGDAALYTPGPSGEPVLRAASEPFAGETLLTTLDHAPPPPVDPARAAHPMDLLLRALSLGVRDYVRKTGFSRVVLGVSGGIDSAVTAAVAARALGPDAVLGVAMPSVHSSPGSVTDALALRHTLGIEVHECPITPMHDAARDSLAPLFRDADLPGVEGVTDENVQSRIRGLLMMALSNRADALLLTTGNKSELAVGYCTLYGDMNGALAVLSDVTKRQVYALARWMNDHPREAGFDQPPVPEDTITKPPSAELAPGQKDEDSLPPYDVLDTIIERYVGALEPPDVIARETGIDPGTIRRIVRLIDVNEYKRKQMPIGLKVSAIAFGRGRRRPIAQGYRPERRLGG